MTHNATHTSDIETLTKLNADYLSSDQNSNVKRYEEILADDFTPHCQIYASTAARNFFN